MNWLDRLDDAVDRLVPDEEDDSRTDDDSSSHSVHSEPEARPLHESLTMLRSQMSEISRPIIRRVVNEERTASAEEESSDHFVSSEQPAGQDSSAVVPLEPDTSMLIEEEIGDFPEQELSEVGTAAEPSSEPIRQVAHDVPDTDRVSESGFRSSDEAVQVDIEQRDVRSIDIAMENDQAADEIDTTVHVRNADHEESSVINVETTLHTDVDSERGDVAVEDAAAEGEASVDESDLPIPHVTSDSREELADFDVSLPLPPWDSGVPLDPSLNCYGVVHVRLVRAQRLPCPVGSSVQGIAALPPWKGRVRTERVAAFLGSEHSGVCVQWDPLHEGGCCSMVHAWNSLATPVPTIKVDLVFHPLQMLEFPMCSVSLSCEPLMHSPGAWKRQWCQTTISQKLNDPDGFLTAEERVPLILLEALFVPTGVEENLSEVNEHEIQQTHSEDSSIDQSPSVGTSLSRSAIIRNHGGSVASGSSFLLTSRNKPHLLRVRSAWIPATCSVCKAVIIGWRAGVQCEACDIDCCKDCVVQVDLQVPCGSSLAKELSASAFHNKVSTRNIMNVVAPWDDPNKKVASDSESKGSHHRTTPASGSIHEKVEQTEDIGIGILKIDVVQACLFEQSLPADSNPDDFLGDNDDRALRLGDYYVRLTAKGSDDTSRTPTIQNTGKPQFDTEELTFNVPHYGMEYRIDVIDVHTDKSVGMALLTAQGLLQSQRDDTVRTDGFSMVPSIQGPPNCTEKRRWRLELRSGMKSGFHDDFFTSSKESKHGSGNKKGEICGWIDADLCLTEDTDRLYSSTPIECPPRPPADLNVEMFHVHIARLGMLVADMKRGAASLFYIISWKNPALTSLSLFLFTTLCLRFNLEHVGSLPLFFLCVYMLYLASIRRRGQSKDRFLERERRAGIESEKAVSVKYTAHRPIGRCCVSVHQGKNIRSRDLGIPGRAGCRIFWDPLRYCKNEKEKASLISVDASLKASHEIGLTNFQYSASPLWVDMEQSEEAKRLQQLLPSHGEFFGADPIESDDAKKAATTDMDHATILFPFLQPIRAARRKTSAGHKDDSMAVKLEQWDSIQGAIVVEVRFRDVISNLPGFDDVLGEVCFPLSQLIATGETCGWYHVFEPGTSNKAIPVTGKEKRASIEMESSQSEPVLPQVYVDIKWIPPESSDNDIESEQEASVVVAEELIRSAELAQNTGIDLMGSSIGAFNTVAGLSGNIQSIQNTLGSALDVVESIRNVFNFTDPYKSSVVFCIVVLLWLFLAMVPTRLLILVGGLALYAANFVAQYYPFSAGGDNKKAENEVDQAQEVTDLAQDQESPIAVWLTNAIRGLPTDEDLRKAYFWESRRVGERERSRLAEEKRSARLKKLWRARWHSTIKLKTKIGRRKSLDERDWQWQEAFAIVQGRRFLWWRSCHDFDSGEAPAGRIFLAGHAGLAGLSPLDLRELDEKEKPSVVNIFGRGLEGQQKLTLLTSNDQSKQDLENAVLEASTKED